LKPALILSLCGMALAARGSSESLPTADEIAARMMERESQRQAALHTAAFDDTYWRTSGTTSEPHTTAGHGSFGAPPQSIELSCRARLRLHPHKYIRKSKGPITIRSRPPCGSFPAQLKAVRRGLRPSAGQPSTSSLRAEARFAIRYYRAASLTRCRSSAAIALP
jgi:hypothetical protein